MGPAEMAFALLRPHVEAAGCELYDVEWKAGLLRVSIDRPGQGGTGIDVDTIASVSRTLSAVLDEQPEAAVPGRYTLEVSSPGLERPLRTLDHYRRAIGTEVTVRTHQPIDGERRFGGVLEAADEAGITVGGRRLGHDQIERARTVFAWGAPPRPKKHKEPHR